jgi:serine/threonine-protein kinase
VVAEGQTLDGTYHLQRLVGEGGMGAVYEATHARLAGRYAIKVLLRELSDQPDIRARFDREAQVTSLLQHPNIVQVIDHNSTADGTSYLVMEFLSGESLGARLARAGRLPDALVVDVVDQIAAGLAAAHARGIVHRDLKPDNVFLVPVEGRATELVKILDFGISKVNWSRDTLDREICGTPQYMTPEQIEGRVADVDATTDQWALAVIAYELLTGTNPFADERIEVIFERVRSGTALPAAGLPDGVASVLAKALSQDRVMRFSSVTSFADAFREAALAASLPQPVAAIVPDAPAASDRVSPAEEQRSRRRGRHVRLGFAAVAAIAVTSFLGTGAADRAPARAPSADGASTAQRLPKPEAEAAAPSTAERSPTPAPVLTAAVAKEVLASPVPRAPARRARATRPPRDDRPLWTIPAAPARRPPPPPLGPDEDATLPPSAF